MKIILNGSGMCIWKFSGWKPVRQKTHLYQVSGLYLFPKEKNGLWNAVAYIDSPDYTPEQEYGWARLI